MPPRRRKRLDPTVFGIPVDQTKSGFFSEAGVSKARELLGREKQGPRALVQVTAREGGYLSGIDEVIAVLKLCADDWNNLIVQALYEGDRFEVGDAVLTIEGAYHDFVHLESACIGLLTRRTGICTSARRLSEVAGSKSLYFVGGGQDALLSQPGDGFAAYVGGIKLMSTPAMASLGGGDIAIVMPRALVATCGGNTSAAARRFAAEIGDEAHVIIPVDYQNDAARTSLDVAKALDDRLWGVWLDTAEFMVDHSIIPEMGGFSPTGVNAQLVWNVRNALDEEGFGDVKIIAGGEGGFSADRIQLFSEEGAPVDAYAVGSALYERRLGFAADVVQVNGKTQARAGVRPRPNPRLERVK